MRAKRYFLSLLAILAYSTIYAYDYMDPKYYDFDVNGIYYTITSNTDHTVAVTYGLRGSIDSNEEDEFTENNGIIQYYYGDGGEYLYYIINIFLTGSYVQQYAYSGSLSIPSSVTYNEINYQVTAIDSHAFENCSGITSIIIPNSVTSIGARAFKGCSGLTSVTIGSTTPPSIYSDTFVGLGSTAILYVPSGSKVAYEADNNWKSTFKEIVEFPIITFADANVKTICLANWDTNGDGQLSEAEATAVTTLGDAFYGNNSITSFDELQYFTGLSSIVASAFSGCTSLTSVIIPNNVKLIGGSAFSRCRMSSITIPYGVTSIGGYAFYGCTLLALVTIPNSVLTIGNCSFRDCSSLYSLTIPNSVTSIGEQAFDGCHLTAVRIPNSVTTIGTNAFYSCGYLTSVKVEKETPISIEQYTFSNCGNATLYVPAGSKAAYEAANYWKEFKEIVEMPESPAIEFADAKVKELCVANWDTNKDGVLSEAEAAAVTTLGEVFRNNKNITSFNELQYFTGLETIGKSAFEGSTVTSVKFPSTLTKIDEWAFAGCKQLRDIDFNGCSAGLEVCAFAECDALEHLELPANIHLWGYAVFHNCKGLKSVVVNNSEDEWADGIFGECSSLETAELYSNNLRSTWTFWNCTSLKSVTFRDAYSGNKYYDQNFYNVPADLVFNIPEGTAESYLKNGYVNLSDKSALPLVREEFEAEAERIAAMADKLADGDKTALTNAVTNARSKVNAAEDYPTIFAQIAAIKEAAKAFIATATLPQNFDVTAATVTNPNFDRFVLGWKFDTHTYNKVGFEDSEISNGDISLNKYLKYCVQDGNGGKIYQTLSNLPAGVYRLEADVYTQNDFGEAKGFSLFANNMAVSSNTEIDKPEHFSVKFEVPTAKDVAIGFYVVHYNFTWMAADNFRLIYEGRAAELPQCAELKSSETDRLYLYNVDADKFLSAGHSMNTHALLDEGGLPVSLTQDGETGYWKIYFFEGSSEDQLLFQNYDGGSEVFVDFNSGWDDGNVDTDIARWSITDAGNGTYLIQNKKRVGTNEYLGNIPTRQDLQDWYSGVSYTDLVADASTADNIHWMLFTKEAYDMMAAKRRLMSTILRMENSGEDDSEELLANARTVYENGSASLHEVIDMTTLLNSQIGMPTADASVDMTAVIVNPRFENNTTEGWTGATVVGGRSDATSNLAHEFFEKDFNMYQTITGVPNGRYLLKWKGFHRPGNWEATCSDFASGTDNASAVVYANSVEKTMKNLASHKSSVRLDDGDVEYGGNYYPNSMEGTRKYFDAGYYADELEVEVTDNVLTIGVKDSQMGGEHWVIFSDFELFILENATTVNNKLVVNDVQSVPGGSATLPVSLVNNDKIVSFSVDVRLPEGVKPMTDSNGNIIVKKTSRVPVDVLGNVTADGACRFVALTSGGAISGNNGEVFSFVIQPSGSMELGEYDVRISNIKLINEELLRIQPFDATSKLTLRKAATGDVNGDGDVDVLDATIIQYYLLGRSPSINLEAADVNGDNEVDILDATIIVFRILGRNTGHAAARQLMSLDPQ